MLGNLENFTLGMGLNIKPYQKLPKKYVSSLNGYGGRSNYTPLNVLLALVVAALIFKKVF